MLSLFTGYLAFGTTYALDLPKWTKGIETDIAEWFWQPRVCGELASPYDAAGWIHVPNVTENPKYCYHACTWPNRPMVGYGRPVEGSFSIKYESLDIWFWLFTARRNSATAPLVIIFREGEPGVPTTQKVFDVTGPCKFGKVPGSPSLNHLSYNQEVNMLYVDGPSPVGLSRGFSPGSSIHDAQMFEWEFLQKFLETFPEYKGREMALWTFDFGAHHAINMAMVIHEQNKDIRDGFINGTLINLTSLGLVSPLLNLPIQQTGAVSFLRSNRHRSVIDNDTHDDLMRQLEFHRPAWEECAVNWTKPCRRELIDFRLMFRDLTFGYPPDPCRHRKPGDTLDPNRHLPSEIHAKPCKERRESFDPWDVRLARGERPRQLAYMAPDGARILTNYLNRKEVKDVLGGKKREFYDPFDHRVFRSMLEHQEILRSSLDVLGQVVRTGLRVLIVGGDCGKFFSISYIITNMYSDNQPFYRCR